MNLSIVGLGYVGCTMVACLSDKNKIIGVDIDQNKIQTLTKGQSPFFEQKIDRLIKEGLNKGNIIATDDLKYAILNSDITFLTIGTPGLNDGNLDVSQIYEVSKKIGTYIKQKNDFHIIVIRSTTPPKTNEAITKLIEENSCKTRDTDFAVVTNPEFLREGTAVNDFYNPGIILVGSTSDIAINKLKELYSDINAEFIATDIEVAEIIKYINNSYHALKVCFANEIGNICKSLNIDGNKVMEIFCKDKKLNISSYYFKPGFAFGGSCLSKDLKALKTLSNKNNVNSPIINSINESNNQQIKNGINLIKSFNSKNIGILGLTFKSNTDDLRFSPILEIVKYLQDNTCNIFIYDKVLKNKKIEINHLFNNKNVPVFKKEIKDLIAESDIVVISNKEDEYNSLCDQYPNKIFIDLCNQFSTENWPNVYSLSK